MPPKELNRHQLSSRLAYNAGETPAFLRKLQNRVKGIPEDEDEDAPQYYDEDGQEFYDDGSGRPPIPQRPSGGGEGSGGRERPPIPERPEGDAGSADEDDMDEAPQVVVLKEGKHLNAREAENERRRARGLPPLPNDTLPAAADDTKDDDAKSSKEKLKSKAPPGLSFSSGGAASAAKKKRKIVGDGAEDDAPEPQSKKPAKKKSKKAGKILLSFGDDEV
ncbi:hypothetical protein CONPUDRAFT_163008 [Coniophora puteana RWD-64-598 SS2]|uniref:DUF4604 domain-containing protein n=1 Tax=Coniophora puteana (strain RWD-64-598) TaxID=741705 RepID=A0A5M3MWZ8_CONPW|nr:uncharacterized protein CONPUDRAFT_163008 [Coniophora puteana RWD-64-598 SS2]EIW83668.1 hypothetical protein CONPUDRAFT_163008 [Coniophora puteana RWD-64-598 SS2]